MSHFERMSALDAAFLEIETSNHHMHGGVILIFEARPLRLEHGGVDIDRIRDYFEAALRQVPRCRQRIASAPLQRRPVWVDDDGFNIHYHVRHSALPRPGTTAQLKVLAARILSQKLDRMRPLWELWVVEGLEGDRFAVIIKVHHCMIDGLAGMDVMGLLLRPDAGSKGAAPVAWQPRPAPSGGELLADELVRRTLRTVDLLAGVGRLTDDPQGTVKSLKRAASSVIEAVGTGSLAAERTPLNPERIGSYRRFDALAFDLQTVKQLGQRWGATVNDVVLALVAGGIRRLLLSRGVAVDGLDYRVMVPVGLRNRRADASLGNRISAMVVKLPLDAADPLTRLQRVRAAAADAKSSRQSRGARLMEELGDWTATAVLSQAMRLGSRAYNLVVTNVPGPTVPLYLLGAKLEQILPAVPLYHNQALGIALISYAGRLYCGLNAAWEAMEDLPQLVDWLEEDFGDMIRGSNAPRSQDASAET